MATPIGKVLSEAKTQPESESQGVTLGETVKNLHREPPAWAAKGVKLATWEAVKPAVADRVVSQPIRWPLYLWGDTGCGKSCLAMLLWRNRGGYWLDASKAIRAVTAAWAAGSAEFLGIPEWPFRDANYQLERLASTPFAVLDDLGVRKPTDSQQEAAYEIAKAREGAATVITCNVSPEALTQVYDDRLVSRLTCGTVLHMRGTDRRIGG